MGWFRKENEEESIVQVSEVPEVISLADFGSENEEYGQLLFYSNDKKTAVLEAHGIESRYDSFVHTEVLVEIISLLRKDSYKLTFFNGDYGVFENEG